MRHTTRFAATLAGLGTALVVAAFPAQAAQATHAATPAGQAHQVGSLVASEYLAGFTAQTAGDGSIESITLPPLTCRAGSYDAITVGVGDEPAANQQVVLADVYLICDNGVASYKTEAYVNGVRSRGPASEGDVLNFAVTYKRHGNATATVTNTTNPAGTVTVTDKATATGLHFGAFPVYTKGTLDPVPTFDKVRLVRAYAAGAPLKGDSATRYQRVNNGQTKLDVTDTIRIPPNAGSFSVIFKHN